MKKTSVELCRLGICPNYVGYQEMHLAIQLALEDPTRLTALVREVYTPVGEATGRHWTAVERNLRTVVRRAWKENPDLLVEIAGRPLERGPGTGDFLGMMWVYLMDGPEGNDETT
ncbi:MAG: sporulation initiation factor Spo0A C-terminal domain-containing protein [Clostridiales bacterium]|nr:sporulation initiation factor Spo0A C-terminal domain-containing protein [Clostridiales bacterium]